MLDREIACGPNGNRGLTAFESSVAIATIGPLEIFLYDRITLPTTDDRVKLVLFAPDLSLVTWE
jgi:hypothetical protein